MAIKVVSDLHGAAQALAQEVRHEDTLLLLGDLINVIDYTTKDGILVEIFGVDAVNEVIGLRAQRRFEEARSVMALRRKGREAEIAAKFKQAFHKAYREVYAVLPHQTYLILGNVDSPPVAEELLPANVQMVDGRVIELQGMRVGFVGGGLPTPLKIAGEVPEEEYNAKLEGLGEVDIICSHVPPDLPELTYDVIADRHERGSSRLVEYIRDVQPKRAFFGHIHQPLCSSTHIGKTHLLNVGYFRHTRRAITLA
ncbi:MAG TPA: metallophosphoesterase [Actinomycetota bacterium]|nr:metallophosphoesterase [Actinomycetota bacterium]